MTESSVSFCLYTNIYPLYTHTHIRILVLYWLGTIWRLLCWCSILSN